MRKSTLVLGVLAATGLACAVAMGGGPPGGGGGGACPTVTPTHAVILVHGRNDTSARWDTLVSSFTSKGYVENTNLFRMDASSYCGGNDYCQVLANHPAASVNESYAKCLKAFIDEKVPCSTDCPDVDIITHSQGGVTARYYARFLAAPRNVNDLILMSGPMQGTNNCALAGACTGINPETCPDSDVMRKLNGVAPQGDGSNDETPNATAVGPVHYGTVVSDKDSVIQPWCSGHLIIDPQTKQADDLDCRRTNYTVDPQAENLKVTSLHLVIPTDSAAIDFAYCEVNEE